MIHVREPRLIPIILARAGLNRAARRPDPLARNDVDDAAPPTAVILVKAGIQYAATFRFHRWRRGILDRPVPVRNCAQGRTMTNMGFSRRHPPEFCKFIPPPKKEGARKTGCALHPRSHVQGWNSKTHMSIQVQRKQSGLPCAMVLRLISCSPRRDRACLPPSLREACLSGT
jgi:hypothetical protein